MSLAELFYAKQAHRTQSITPWRRRKLPPRRRKIVFEPLEGRLLLSVGLVGIPDWLDQGPAPTTGGQVFLAAPDDAVSGAVESLAAHPTNPDILYAGGVLGGVWKTTNATSATPNWTPLTDQLPTLAISDLAFSPLDGTNNTLFAGTGGFSNGLFNGPAQGILRTTDGGATWQQFGQTTFANDRIRSIVPTAIGTSVADQVVLVAAIDGGGGVYRSIDGGANFTLISGTSGSSDGLDNDDDGTIDEVGELNLPTGAASYLTGDPGNANRFYAAIPTKGIFRSDNGGANWVQVNNGLSGLGAGNIELSVSAAAGNPVYAGFVNGGVLANVFRSADQGENWAAIGTAPAIHPGTQGFNNFSILADRAVANLVYVGGDRQGGAPFVGNIFRGDASDGSWDDITFDLFNSGLTAPHADSRDMVFDADGNLLEADDGGIFRFAPFILVDTWTNLNRNLGVAEFYSAPYDHVRDVIFGGTQDTGSARQSGPGSLTWNTINQGDGGTAGVGYGSINILGVDFSFSVQYTMGNNFGTFERHFSDIVVEILFGGGLGLTGLDGADSGFTGFTTFPYEVNPFDGDRLVIGGLNNLYESTDFGDNLTIITPAGVTGVSALAYGGSQGGTANPDVIYAGVGGNLYLRTSAGGAFTQLTAYTGGTPTDIVLDPDDWQGVYVTDGAAVYHSVDAGANWTTVNTAGLAALTTGLNTVEVFSPTATLGDEILLAGGASGVFRTRNPSAGAAALWSEFGANLPNAPVADLQYDGTDDVLVASAWGRGVWKIASASDSLPVAGVFQIDGDTDFAGQDDIIKLIRDPNNTNLLDVFLNNLVTEEISIPIGAIEQINVNGLGGNDTLMVDSTNGLINVVNGIRYDGDGGSDSLQLLQTGGPIRTSDTYSVGPANGQGLSTTVGSGTAGTQSVRFENLEPVLDLVPAALLTVNATGGDNAINYSTGTLVTQGLVSVDAHETIEFANKTALVINAGAGQDTISLNNPNTPTGLTGITVNGGDPTSGDALIVNGTAATLTVNTGTTNIGGAGPVTIAYNTVEALTVNAGPSTTLGVTGSASYTYTPGVAADAGSLQTASIAIAFTGIGSGETLSLSGVGGADSIVANGTAANDTFTVAATTGNVTLAGRLTIAPTLIEALTLNGLEGDDTFSATGPQSYTNITLAGGDPSASDIASLTGDGTAVTLNLGGATASVSGGGLGSVSLPSIEVLNLSAGAGGITVNGTSGPNAYNVTPTGANTATLQVGSLAPVVNTTNTGALTLNDGSAADGDTLTVNGTTADESIVVNSSTTTIQVGALKAVGYTAVNVESLRVNGNAGSDTFDVTPGSRPIFIDGADPVGVTPGDRLNILAGGGSVTYNAGAETDEGSFDVGANQPVSFDHIESFGITGSGPAIINGTNGPDAITVIARDVSTHTGTDGVQDFTVSVNAGPELLFLEVATLTVNAISGSDEVVLRTPAPNNAVWNVQVTIDGGPPSASDTLVVETPGAVAETVVYTPSASDGGTLNLSSLTSLVTVTQIEELRYDGEADNDTLTVVGTTGDDTIVHTPGAGNQEGTFRVNDLLALSYQNLGAGASLTADGDGGADTLVVNGTEANDSFTIGAAGQVNLNSRLAVSTLTIETLTLEGFDGDDVFTLVPEISASVYATINLSGGGQASATGDRANLVATAGPDNINVSGQVVSLGGVTVNSNGVEDIRLNALAGDDLLTYNGVSGVTENITVSSSGVAGGGQISIPGVVLLNFENTERIDVNGNSPTPTETDTLTFAGTNAVDIFNINLAAAGTDAYPILKLQSASAATLLTLRNYNNFNTLRVNTLDGEDTINVLTAASVPSRNLFVDGGLPSGKKKSTDNLNVFYTAPRPRIIHSAATQDPDAGLVDLNYGNARFLVQYDGIEQVVIRRA